jgi:radical SAM protein with 4Fe4S-binding SPASM domain
MPRRTRDTLFGFRKQPGLRAFLAEHIVLDQRELLWNALVDVSRGCNLRCTMCITTARTPRALASRELLERVRTEILPRAVDVAIGCQSDPLLHPDLVGFTHDLRAARDSQGLDAFLIVLTSGTLLDSQSSVELARSGLDLILFSVDSSDPQTYESMRRGASWTAVRDGIRQVVAARNGMHPEIGAMALLNRQTLPHLSRTARDLADMGIMRLQINQMIAEKPSLKSVAMTLQGPDEASIREHVDAAVSAGRKAGVEVTPPVELPPPVPGEPFPLFGSTSLWDEVHAARTRECVCTIPWSGLRVDAMGNVFPCHRMFGTVDGWGSLMERSFLELVNGPEAIAMREALLHGRASNPTCARCLIGPGGWHK